MYIIRSADEMARYLTSQLDPDLSCLLIAKCNELSDYDGYELGNLASFLIIQPGDTLEEVEACLGFTLSDPEYKKRKGGWTEMAFVLSDDGYGWMIYLPIELAGFDQS